jgi:hypothetical protein
MYKKTRVGSKRFGWGSHPHRDQVHIPLAHFRPRAVTPPFRQGGSGFLMAATIGSCWPILRPGVRGGGPVGPELLYGEGERRSMTDKKFAESGPGPSGNSINAGSISLMTNAGADIQQRSQHRQPKSSLQRRRVCSSIIMRALLMQEGSRK